MMNDIESMGDILREWQEEHALLAELHEKSLHPGKAGLSSPRDTRGKCKARERNSSKGHASDGDESDDNGDYVCCSKQRDQELMLELEAEDQYSATSDDTDIEEKKTKIIELEHQAKECLNSVAKKYAAALRLNIEMQGLQASPLPTEEELSPKHAKRQRQKAKRGKSCALTTSTSWASGLSSDFNAELPTSPPRLHAAFGMNSTPSKSAAPLMRSHSLPNFKASAEWQQLQHPSSEWKASPLLPDAVMFVMLGFLGESIVAGSAVCRRWSHLAYTGAGSDYAGAPTRFCCASDAMLSHFEADNILLNHEGANNTIGKRPYYAGRVVVRNDVHASWRSLTPGDVPTWGALPKAAESWIITHASWEELLDGPKLEKSPAEWQRLISMRFTLSMMPDTAPSGRNSSSKKTSENLFNQALIQERDQTRLYSSFSSFDSLLPLSLYGLAFQVNVVVFDADKKGHVGPRDVNHCGFNLMGLVFGNYNFTAMGAGQRARMQYFYDIAGDQDSVEWMNDVPAAQSNREVAAGIADFQPRWEAIRDVDVYTVNESDPFDEDSDFDIYEDRLLRVFWKGRFMLCFWFRLGFCPKEHVSASGFANSNAKAEELLSTITGGNDWARYPQYNKMYECARIPELCRHGDKGRVVGKMVSFGGMARDVYNEDDYNVSFSQGLQMTVLPITAEDLKGFQAGLETANGGSGALVEVYSEVDHIADSSDGCVERVQGYDHANMEQMVWHMHL